MLAPDIMMLLDFNSVCFNIVDNLSIVVFSVVSVKKIASVICDTVCLHMNLLLEFGTE